MKKILFLVSTCFALMANESGFYIGAEASRTTINVSGKTSSSDIHATTTTTSGAAKIGYYINESNRAYIAFQAIPKGGFNAGTNIYSAGYDYLFGSSSFKPFVGAVLGYADVQFTEPINGMAYGAQAGVNYLIGENFSLDAGFRYLMTSASHTSSNGSETRIDNIQSLFVGANYKF